MVLFASLYRYSFILPQVAMVIVGKFRQFPRCNNAIHRTFKLILAYFATMGIGELIQKRS